MHHTAVTLYFFKVLCHGSYACNRAAAYQTDQLTCWCVWVRSGEQATSDTTSSASQDQHVAPQPQAMGHKNDLIVWLQLHPAQRHIYEVGFALA